MDLRKMCQDAYACKNIIGMLDTKTKNQALLHAADVLIEQQNLIIEANKIDITNAIEKNISKGLLDRLTLTKSRIADMAEGLRQVASLQDPIGEVMSMTKRPNGLSIGRRRVALGVVGVIYESRPNVTADAFGLCFKTGNCVILKGGSDAIHSNKAIVIALKKALNDCNIPENALNLIESTDRNTTMEFMKMKEYVDVLIPRGGSGLIQSVVNNATIPVIETGVGNCHIYVDDSADMDMALHIIENAKTQRVGVCNACESLLIHKDIAKEFLPKVYTMLADHHVEMRVEDCLLEYINSDEGMVQVATAEDWGTEYLDYIISVKSVSDIDDAICHINKYNTSHSESIITNNYDHAQKFLNEVDAACVYVNASTRFSDGNEFGFGAEIGISTQKLHARGPMGLEALTSYKYIIYGDGQIRE